MMSFSRAGHPSAFMLLRVTQDSDDGVIRVDDDPIMRTAPLGVLSEAVVGVVTALPSSCGPCRIDADWVQSGAVSVMAIRAAFSSTMA